METETIEMPGEAAAATLPPLAEDLLRGVPKIAEHIRHSPRAVHHLIEKGSIPVFRLPNNSTIYARKSELDRVFQSAS